MLTLSETRDVDIYGKKAMDSVEDMRELINYFDDPMNNMTWGEFSRAMHRHLIKYDDSANKLEAIYKANFKRMFCDDDDEEE